MRHYQFKNIVLRHKDLIYNQAFYFTSNCEDAEDITQEVFIKLWHHFDKVKRNSVKAWLLKVTRNLCIDYSRKNHEQSLSELYDNDTTTSVIDNLMDFSANPEQEIITKDLSEKIMFTINLLPEKIRNILILRDIQDLKYDTIAEIMDLPLNSIKVYLHRGRKYLLENLPKSLKEELFQESFK